MDRAKPRRFLKDRSGDHIDLWNKNRITGGSMFYRSIIELFGFVSDLNKSREVWFCSSLGEL